jgi:hypothetical protein
MMLPYQDDTNTGDAGQLLDQGSSPLSMGLPPPANTGASLPGMPAPPQAAPIGMSAGMDDGGAPQPGMTEQAAGMLNGGGQLNAAHGEALRGMVRKMASMMGR